MELPAALQEALAAGRLPHAVLLAGTQPSALHAAALAVARRLLCAHPKGAASCGVCRSCTSFDAGSNPDLVTVTADGASIKVEQIRALKDKALLSPMGGAGRAMLIERAELMTVQAQNALLKLLEEPPPELTFLLTTMQKDALLATISSRVTVYLLEDTAKGPSEALARTLLECLCEHDYYALLALHPALCTGRETFLEHCDALCLICHRLLCEKAGSAGSALAARTPAVLAASLPAIALRYKERARKTASLPLLGAAMLIECWEVLH